MKATQPLKFLLLISTGFLLWACDSAPHALDQQTLHSIKQAELQKESLERLEKAERPIMVQWQEVNKKQSLFDFDCEDCPQSFGQLITREDGFMKDKDGNTIPAIYSGNCQGGLIDEDLFMTSRHCLPQALQEAGVSCEDQAQVIFPKTQDSPREIAQCESIIAFAPLLPGLEEKDAQPDWALIKLKKPLKKRISNLSRDGIKDGQKLYAYLPLRSIDGEFINLELLTCEAVQNSLLLPEFQEDKSPLVFIQCDKDMTKGFSGTLLFDGLGVDARPVATLSHIWDEGKGIDNVIISKNAVASDLSCAIFEEGAEKPEYCHFDPTKKLPLKQKAAERALKRAHEKSIELFENWLNQSNSPIQWEKVTEANINSLPNLYADYVKRRIEERNDYVPTEKRGLYIRSILPYYAYCVKDKTPQELSIPAIQVEILKNERGQLYTNVKLVEHPGKLHFNDGEGRYVTPYTGDHTTPPASENYILNGYFSHQVYVMPCE